MTITNYDEKERTVAGHLVKVVVFRDEVCGYVDGSQIYGVYVDDPDRLRVSTAISPTGEFQKSWAYVKCMTMVCEVVSEITGKALSKS